MKNKLVSTILMASLALQLAACGASDNQTVSSDKTESVTDNSQSQDDEETTDENTESAGEATADGAEEVVDTENNPEASDNNEEAVGMANPWRSCTEEEAIAACPRMFKLPEDGLVASWSMMDAEDSESGVPGPVVQLDFRMEGMDYTARAQYGASEDADISGLYYDWDVTDDITLANWGEGNMQGKLSRHIEDGWTVDLCTWYDIEIGIAYSLSVEAEDLDGFDLQAIAEQMYNPDNEPYTGMEDEEVAQGDKQAFEGQYYAGRGNLSITGQGSNEYLIEVWWGSSAAEHSEWVMHGQYDESTATITYSDCEKHDYTLKEDGEIESDVTAYTDGKGSIKIVDDSTIIWTDEEDHIADDVPMTR